MSQRGPTSRPSSRHRSQSQSTGAHTSPLLLQRANSSLDDSRADSPRGFGGHEPSRQATPRTLGVHNILNPSDPRDQHGRVSPSVQRHLEGGSSPSSSGTRQYGVSGSPYQTHGPLPLYGGPAGSTIPPVTRHESPTPVRPFPPALGAARRILTPRSPRSLSLSRLATPSTYAEPQPPLGYPPSAHGRPGGHQETASFPMPVPGASHQSPRMNPLSVVPPTSAPPRSFSQPSLPNPPAFQFPQDPSQSGATARSPQGGASTYPSGQYGLPQDRTRGYAPSAASPGEGNLSTAIMSALQTGGGSVRGSDVQPHLTLQTNTGEHITVPLDVHQGSRQADEKRHRNAGASARFRARKKERDKDMKDNLQRLENENRDLTRQNQELQAEREFYRNEMNRYRELVLRTPTIREHAEHAPTSPRASQTAVPIVPNRESSFGTSFVGGGNSATNSPPGTQQHPPPYSGELERPTRRRRTESDFATAPYPMRPAQTPSNLPPIVTGYTTPISSAPPSARLPPLRFDQTSASPTAAHPPGGFTPLQGPPQHIQTQFPSYVRQAHETGWATGSREQHHEGRHESPGSAAP